MPYKNLSDRKAVLEGDYSSWCPCEKRRKVPYQLPQLLTLESKRKEGRKEGQMNLKVSRRKEEIIISTKMAEIEKVKIDKKKLIIWEDI